MPENKVDIWRAGGLHVETSASGNVVLTRAYPGAEYAASISFPVEVLPDLIAELERLQREGMGGS